MTVTSDFLGQSYPFLDFRKNGKFLHFKPLRVARFSARRERVGTTTIDVT